jgi:hypothetical protein
MCASNVLLTDELRTAKISGFHMSRTVDAEKDYYSVTSELPLPVRWMAPEAILTLKYTRASDGNTTCALLSFYADIVLTVSSFISSHLSVRVWLLAV